MAEPFWTVITGASSGIGAALARAFAARGHSLVLVARRRERLDALAGELSREHGIEAESIVLDLEDPSAPHRLIDALASRAVTVHTLVNNAGFGLRGGFVSLPADRQAAMIAVNVGALTSLCRLVLPGLVRRRSGGIINVSSTAAFQAGPNMAVYYATKAYVLSLSEALYEEVRSHGVTVTALCPGPTETEFAKTADMEGSRLFRHGAMSPEEVARIGVEGYERGQAVVVPGPQNRIGAIAAQLLPRALTRRIVGGLQP